MPHSIEGGWARLVAAELDADRSQVAVRCYAKVAAAEGGRGELTSQSLD
jgi:hypothetical protein